MQTHKQILRLHETMTVKKKRSNEDTKKKIQRIIQYFNLGLHRKIHSTHINCVSQILWAFVNELNKKKATKKVKYCEQSQAKQSTESFYLNSV